MDERTPPVRRPARREARLFVYAVVIAFVERIDYRIESYKWVPMTDWPKEKKRKDFFVFIFVSFIRYSRERFKR